MPSFLHKAAWADHLMLPGGSDVSHCPQQGLLFRGPLSLRKHALSPALASCFRVLCGKEGGLLSNWALLQLHGTACEETWGAEQGPGRQDHFLAGRQAPPFLTMAYLWVVITTWIITGSKLGVRLQLTEKHICTGQKRRGDHAQKSQAGALGDGSGFLIFFLAHFCNCWIFYREYISCGQKNTVIIKIIAPT